VSVIARLKRRFLRWIRIITGRKIRYRIGQNSILLPPGHFLPTYQKDFPFYDRYYLKFFSEYATEMTNVCLIDIGANVGDTAAHVLAAAPGFNMLCVEGSPFFLDYLRSNTASFNNIEIIDAFVTNIKEGWAIESDGSTGHLIQLVGKSIDSKIPTVQTVEARCILDVAKNLGNTIIWKSDTDGYDISIILESFNAIVSTCEIVWFEFDPVGNLSDSKDVGLLLQKIHSVNRQVVVFDNFGHRIFSLPAREAAGILTQLTSWLQIQTLSGNPQIRYFDVWLLPPDLAEILVKTTSSIPSP
jgi:FkbM family methyltransferase